MGKAWSCSCNFGLLAVKAVMLLQPSSAAAEYVGFFTFIKQFPRYSTFFTERLYLHIHHDAVYIVVFKGMVQSNYYSYYVVTVK